MTRTIAALAAAAFMAAPFARAADYGYDAGYGYGDAKPGTKAASKAEQALARGEAALDELEARRAAVAASPAATPAEECARAFSLEALLADVDRSKGLPGGLAAAGDEIKMKALQYYTCAAYADDDRSVCRPHPAFDVTFEHGAHQGDSDVWRWHYVCYAHFNEMTIVRALITRAPDFQKVCPANLAATATWEEPEFKDADLPQVCRILDEDSQTPEKACARLGPLYLESKMARKCPRELRRLAGDPAVCAEFSTPIVRDFCAGYTAFHKASSSGKPEDCAGSPVCRVLLERKREACAPLEAAVRDAVCSRAPAAGGWAATRDALLWKARQAAQEAAKAGAKDTRRLASLKTRAAALEGAAPQGGAPAGPPAGP
jgi:hypothetical protein